MWRENYELCPVCPSEKGKHFLAHCPVFLRKFSTKERWAKVKELNRCPRCISPRHSSVAMCRMTKRCDICQSPNHHSALHEFEGEENICKLAQTEHKVLVARKNEVPQTRREDRKLSICFAVVKVGNPFTQKMTTVNACIDKNCSLTQCHSEVAEAIGLSGTPSEITNKGVGGVRWSSTCFMADAVIESMDGEFISQFPITFTDKCPTGDLKPVN